MELAERLRETLRREFGITTDEELLEAVRKINLDIGIFTTPLERGTKKCAQAS